MQKIAVDSPANVFIRDITFCYLSIMGSFWNISQRVQLIISGLVIGFPHHPARSAHTIKEVLDALTKMQSLLREYDDFSLFPTSGVFQEMGEARVVSGLIRSDAFHCVEQTSRENGFRGICDMLADQCHNTEDALTKLLAMCESFPASPDGEDDEDALSEYQKTVGTYYVRIVDDLTFTIHDVGARITFFSDSVTAFILSTGISGR